MPFSRRSVFAFLLALAAAPAPAKKNLAPPPQEPRRAGAVVTRTLAEVALYPEREAAAQAVSLNESRIAAEIAGRIEAIEVEPGERVARGALLARLDCRDHEIAAARARAALEGARARLALAEQQHERARELAARGFFSAEALAARATEARVLRAEVEQAKAQAAGAEHAVEKCVVRAPFPAIVRERLGHVGELAAPGTPLVALAAADRIEVSAQVPLALAESLRRAAAVRFDGDGGMRELRLLRISPAIEPRARTVEARLAFAAAPAAPGAAGRIRWRDPEPHLPPEILVRRAGALGVFLDEGGVARFHALEGAQEGRPARAARLSPATRLVVSGQFELEDGRTLK